MTNEQRIESHEEIIKINKKKLYTILKEWVDEEDDDFQWALDCIKLIEDCAYKIGKLESLDK